MNYSNSNATSIIDVYFTDIPDFSKLQGLTKFDDLACVTNQISPEMILSAYQNGIFPWIESDKYTLFYWFEPNQRAILLPKNLHIRRSLAQTIRKKTYQITINQSFNQVIDYCANVPRNGQDGTWISHNIKQTYQKLHTLGKAHSFECWFPKPENPNEWELVGGLYGVEIGSVFHGESMFSLKSDASKLAFAHAVQFLQKRGVKMIDCQQDTPYLASFGSHTIPAQEYRKQIQSLHQIPLNPPIADLGGWAVLAENGN